MKKKKKERDPRNTRLKNNKKIKNWIRNDDRLKCVRMDKNRRNEKILTKRELAEQLRKRLKKKKKKEK